MAGKLTLLFLTPLILLQGDQTFALTDGVGLLSPRQNAAVPSGLPTNCLSGCEAVANVLQSCDSEPTPELLLECSCTQTNADNLSACVACVANTIPGAAVVSQAESILSQYYGDCAEAGIALSTPAPSSPLPSPSSPPSSLLPGFSSPSSSPTPALTNTATGVPANADPFKSGGMAVSLSVFVCLIGAVVGAVVVLA